MISKAVVQSNVPGNDELVTTNENGTNEMAAPEMISKAVVQSNVPDEKNEDNETEIGKIKMLNIRNRNGGPGNCQVAREPTGRRQQK